MLARASADDGFGLVEVLIAMMILAIAIMAIFAGFGAGALSLQRASRASTAATVADREMEKFRRFAYSAITPVPSTTVAPSADSTGADNRVYWMQTTISWTCVITGATVTPTVPPTCTGATTPSRPVKKVEIVVRDGSATAPVLIRETSTFDEATGT